LTIALNRDRHSIHQRDNKMSIQTLILCTKLSRAINAAHTEDDGWQVVNASVVPHILIGCSLGAAIGRVKVERSRLRDTIGQSGEDIPAGPFDNRHVFHSAIYFIRGGKYHDWLTSALPGCFKYV